MGDERQLLLRTDQCLPERRHLVSHRGHAVVDRRCVCVVRVLHRRKTLRDDGQVFFNRYLGVTVVLRAFGAACDQAHVVQLIEMLLELPPCLTCLFKIVPFEQGESVESHLLNTRLGLINHLL